MGLVLVCQRGLWIYIFIIMLLVGMSWADMLSVMLARGVMCDVRQSAPRGGPLTSDWRRALGISAAGGEPRGLEEPRRFDWPLDSGLGTRSTK